MFRHFILIISLLHFQILYGQTKDSCASFTLDIHGNSTCSDSMRLIYYDSEKATNRKVVFAAVGDKFTIYGKINRISEFILLANYKTQWVEGPDVIRFIGEPSKMSVSFDCTKDSVYNVKITGSKTQVQKEKWERSNADLLTGLQQYHSILMNSKLTKFEKEKISDSIEYLYRKIVSNSISYIKQHPTSYLSAYLLKTYIRRISLDSIQVFYSNFSDPIKQSQIGQRIVTEVLARTNDTSFIKANSSPAFFDSLKKIKGLYDISLSDNKGEILSLSKFKGKYVVLDFWASWCGPCIENIPYLKKIKLEMQGEPVEFVSISIDRDIAKWKAALTKYHPPGLNLIDTAQLSGFVYKVPWVPKYIIISPKGVVIDDDAPQPISGELKPLLISIMNRKKE